MGAQRAGNIADLLVSQFLEMADRQIHSLFVVNPDVGCHRVADDMVIIERCRGVAGLQVLHPRFAQRESEQKRPGEIVLQHKCIVRDLALEGDVYRDDGDLTPGRLGGLAESHDNIVGELVGLLIFNIVPLYDDAQLPDRFFIAPEFRIAQFYGSLQHLFL